MRFLAASLILLSACSTSSGGVSGAVDSTAVQDSGAALTTDDFASFSWSFTGTGVGRAFSIDRDCGVEAMHLPPVENGSGVAPTASCATFQQLVVSPRVVGALRDTSACNRSVTDDMESMTLTLIDGGSIAAHTTGCRGVAPYDDVYRAIDLVEGVSVTFHGPDAGSDADASID